MYGATKAVTAVKTSLYRPLCRSLVTLSESIRIPLRLVASLRCFLFSPASSHPPIPLPSSLFPLPSSAFSFPNFRFAFLRHGLTD